MCFCQTHKSPASLDVEPSSQIPGLTRWGAFIPNPWPRSTGSLHPKSLASLDGSLHPKSLASLDGEPSFQIPGLTRRGASIHVRASVIHVWVWEKYSPTVFTSGDVNCVPLMPDEGASGGVDEGAAAREVAAMWGKASKARRPKGPGVVKGGELGILCVSGSSVFWVCQQEDAGGQGRDLYVEKTSLVFLSYRCPGGEGTA